jgi:hypothetical protein
MKVLFKLLGLGKSLWLKKEEIDLAKITQWVIGRICLNLRCSRQSLRTGCCYSLHELDGFVFLLSHCCSLLKLDIMNPGCISLCMYKSTSCSWQVVGVSWICVSFSPCRPVVFLCHKLVFLPLFYVWANFPVLSWLTENLNTSHTGAAFSK